ncbi:hypothetical protein HN419_03445 [Candidatus Woesearchaeota archaeon]|nr:hypothetical protein [Candidatus Woesearchaeota archaeon]MBT3538068.1 hypothetical protein [Candidatus Woesearchaeota archaeon]MBT4697152.1 hypothetical protein [Candidatus Woesearchaeota archaeon]MBT4717143.1 hypothetical protein [Candidatus Woesearchaeota archaeon]MBT7105737.1 hypothetical protein [Candidatus Woesearchaeota archaeon]
MIELNSYDRTYVEPYFKTQEKQGKKLGFGIDPKILLVVVIVVLMVATTL